MDTEVADREGDGSVTRKKPDSWKLPKIPVDQVYKTKTLRIFPSYIIKDFEETLILDSTNQESIIMSFSLVSCDFINSFAKKQHKFLHLGLVQVGVKPLARVGSGAPIIVSLTDSRLRDPKNSLLAMVETDFSDGPFYFNCFPSFSVSCLDKGNRDILVLSVKTGGIPLALTYRTVCKAMVDLNSEALGELTVGKTTYFQLNAGTPKSTKWDEVQVPHEWTTAVGFQGVAMNAEAADKEVAGSASKKKKLESWKLPKIPVDQVYEKNQTIFFPSLQNIKPFTSNSYVIKDVEKTVNLDSSSQYLHGTSFSLVNEDFMNWFQRKRHRYVHWGLVQVAIKPLTVDGALEAPIIVCLRDDRTLDFKSSFLATVVTDLSKGPFYFNCYPSYPIPNTEISRLVLTLNVETIGVPLALSLTYRIVCKATSNLFLVLSPNRLTRGETTYFQGDSELPKTTKWDEVQVSE